MPLTLLALLGVIFLFYRVRLLTSTVTAAHFTVHKVAVLELTLPSFLSYFTTPLATNAYVSTVSVIPNMTCECEFPYSTYLALTAGTVFVRLLLVFVKCDEVCILPI